MATQKVKDLAVKTGSYTDNQGQEKGRYQNVGSLMRSDDGNEFIVLHRWFNPAGVPNPENRDSVLISCFEPKQPGQQQQGWGQPQQPQQQMQRQPPMNQQQPNPRQQQGGQQQQRQQRQAPAPAYNEPTANFDDDIPFNQVPSNYRQ